VVIWQNVVGGDDLKVGPTECNVQLPNVQLPNVQIPNVQIPNATIIVPTSQSGTTSNLFGGTGKSRVNLQENAKHEPALRVEFFIEN